MPNLDRRSLLKTASMSLAGAPFLNLAAPSLLAQSSIPALSPSVQANLIQNLTAVYTSARERNVTTAQLSTLNGALGIANGLLEDNGTLSILQPRFAPATFSWTSSLQTSLVQNAGSQITPIAVTELGIMWDWKEYLSQVPTNASAAVSYVMSGLKKQAAFDKLKLRETGPHVILAAGGSPDPNQNMDCGWAGMAIAAGIVAGILFFIPGGQFVAGLFTLIAAIYAALDYLNVGC
jgi:hypothetical protein